MIHLLLRPENLVIVRHAESEMNVGKAGLFYTDEERSKMKGVLNQDLPITEKGIQQAKDLGEKLSKEVDYFDLIITSGYRRTKETMDHILSGYSPDHYEKALILEDIALRERDTGYTYHMTQQDVEYYFPWNEDLWSRGDDFFTRPMGGESLADVVTRLEPFLMKLAMICKGKNVLLVTHGRTITAIRSILENWKHEDYKNLPKNLDNAEMLHYEFSDMVGFLTIKKPILQN